MTPLFVFSAPRSGSTLLMRYLHDTPGGRFGGETDNFWWPLHTLFSQAAEMKEEFPASELTLAEQLASGNFPSRFAPPEELIHDACRRHLLATAGVQPGTSPDFWGWKDVYIGRQGAGHEIFRMIHILFPAAQLVMLFRDPEACLTSMMTRWREWWQGRYAQCPSAAERAIRAQQRVMKEYLAHPSGPAHRVTYEDLVSDNFPAKFASLTGVQIPESVFQHHRSLKIRA